MKAAKLISTVTDLLEKNRFTTTTISTKRLAVKVTIRQSLIYKTKKFYQVEVIKLNKVNRNIPIDVIEPTYTFASLQLKGIKSDMKELRELVK